MLTWVSGRFINKSPRCFLLDGNQESRCLRSQGARLSESLWIRSFSPERPACGGLALFWKSDLNLKILNANRNVIDTEITHKDNFFFGSFIYGEPDVSKRCLVWDQLLSISDNRDQPWFLTGDFNEIIDNSEKDGRPLRAEGSFAAFCNLLAHCDLFDLKYSGNLLSWRGQRRTHLVFYRLYRAIVNSQWSNLFPTERSHYIEFNGSDHRPLVSIFDSVWKKSPESLDMIDGLRIIRRWRIW